MPRLRPILRRLLGTTLPLLLCLACLAAWARGYSASDGLVWFYRPNDSLAAFHSAGNLYLDHQSWTHRARPVGSARSTFRSYIGYEPDELYARVAAWHPMTPRPRGVGRFLSGSAAGPAVTGRYVILPLWSLAAVAALPLLARATRALQLAHRRRRRTAGLCPTCGYDLRATPDRCPECGASAAPASTP